MFRPVDRTANRMCISAARTERGLQRTVSKTDRADFVSNGAALALAEMALFTSAGQDRTAQTRLRLQIQMLPLGLRATPFPLKATRKDTCRSKRVTRNSLALFQHPAEQSRNSPI
ncbi:hypothetical protein SKAU_G00292580 [Synaphobranchus kaupii]|uniref:Uncharacterized protein n=1 Tax=Synaphobranchus kaupii TaxID=118154 RepID=A0A9Q1EU47_SYNKA|nr:hypothetical protein SKAU_G00292580 [Synaphobranchus kaupii]